MTFESVTKGCVIKRKETINRRFDVVRLTTVKISGGIGPSIEGRESPDGTTLLTGPRAGENCTARRVLIWNLFSTWTSRNPNGREFRKTKRKRHLPTVLNRIVREQYARIEQRYYYIIRLMDSSIIYAHSRTTATTMRPNIVTWPSVNDFARGINFVTQSLCDRSNRF